MSEAPKKFMAKKSIAVPKKRPLEQDDIVQAKGVEKLHNGNVRRAARNPSMRRNATAMNYWQDTVPDTDDGKQYSKEHYDALYEIASDIRENLGVTPGAPLPPNTQPAEETWVEYQADSVQALIDKEINPPFFDTARNDLDANCNRAAVSVFDDAFTLNEAGWDELKAFMGEDRLCSLLFCFAKNPPSHPEGLDRPEVGGMSTGQFHQHAFLNDGAFVVRRALPQEDCETLQERVGDTRMRGMEVQQMWTFRGESGWGERQVYEISAERFDPENDQEEIEAVRQYLRERRRAIEIKEDDIPSDSIHEHFKTILGIDWGGDVELYPRYDFPDGEYPRFLRDELVDLAILRELDEPGTGYGYSIWKAADLVKRLQQTVIPLGEHELTAQWCRTMDIHAAQHLGWEFVGEGVLQGKSSEYLLEGFDILSLEKPLMEVATNYLTERFTDCTLRVLGPRKLTPYSMPQDGFPTVYVNVGPGRIMVAYTDATEFINLPKYFSMNPPAGAVHEYWSGFDTFQSSSIYGLEFDGRKMKFALVNPGDAIVINWNTAFIMMSLETTYLVVKPVVNLSWALHGAKIFLNDLHNSTSMLTTCAGVRLSNSIQKLQKRLSLNLTDEEAEKMDNEIVNWVPMNYPLGLQKGESMSSALKRWKSFNVGKKEELAPVKIPQFCETMSRGTPAVPSYCQQKKKELPTFQKTTEKLLSTIDVEIANSQVKRPDACKLPKRYTCLQERIVSERRPIKVVCNYQTVGANSSNINNHVRLVHGGEPADWNPELPLNKKERHGTRQFQEARKYFGVTGMNGNVGQYWGPENEGSDV